MNLSHSARKQTTLGNENKGFFTAQMTVQGNTVAEHSSCPGCDGKSRPVRNRKTIHYLSYTIIKDD